MHNKPSVELQQIGYKISSFYLEKHKGDYLAAQKDVQSLNVQNIEFRADGVLIIYVNRPGLLIGRKGSNIESLQKYLNLEIEIVESFSWDDVLIPHDWSDIQ